MFMTQCSDLIRGQVTLANQIRVIFIHCAQNRIPVSRVHLMVIGDKVLFRETLIDVSEIRAYTGILQFRGCTYLICNVYYWGFLIGKVQVGYPDRSAQACFCALRSGVYL